MDGDTKHGPDRLEDDDPLAVTASTSPPEKEWAIDAESKWYRRYWFASAPVTLAAVALAPLRLAFCGDASTGANALAWGLDVFAWCDVVLLTFVRAPDETLRWRGRLERDWLRYVGRAPGLIPFDAFARGRGPLNAGRLLGLLRMLRFRRCWAALKEFGTLVWLPHWVSVVTDYLVFYLLAGHTEGCLFYLLARGRNFAGNTWVAHHAINLDAEPLRARYLKSLSWAFTTISTVGYGDVYPVSQPEMIFTIVAVVANLGLMCYTVASISTMFRREEEVAAFRQEATELTKYLRANGVEPTERRKLVAYKARVFRTTATTHVLDGFPAAVRTRVLFEGRWSQMLATTRLFVDVASRARQEVLGRATEALYMEGMVICGAGAAPTAAYLLHAGAVSVVVGGEVVGTLKPGAPLCCEAFFAGALQRWTLVAATTVSVVALPAEAFRDDPADLTIVLRNLRRDANAFAHRARGLGELKREDDAAYTAAFARIELSPAFADACDAAVDELRAAEQRTEASLAEVLCDYCARGDAKRAARLLERLPRGGRYRDLADYDKRSPAHLAAAHGRTEILRLLDEYGLALDGVDIFGGTPLYDAAVKAHDAEAAVDFLRERCGPLVVADLAGTLCRFAFDANVAVLQRLLRAGADPDAADYDQRRALHIAAAEGHAKTCRLLLDAGAPVDCRDRWGQTPLIEAVAAKHLDCVELLLERGADASATDRGGRRVALAAVDAESDDCLAAVVAGGGADAGDDVAGATRLCAAAAAGDLTLVERLVRAGVAVDAADYDRRTALHLAAAEGRVAVVMKLCEHGADIRFRDRWGHDAIDAATGGGHADLVAQLHLLEKH